MSRALAYFLAFLAVLVAAALFLSGRYSAVVGLVLDDDRRNSAYQVLSLTRPGKLDAVAFESRYRAPLGDLLHSEGARLLHDGVLFHPLSGSSAANPWQHLQVIGFDQGSSLLQLYTGRSYRLLRDELGEDDLLLLGAPAPLSQASEPVWVLWLYERRDAQHFDEFEVLLQRAADFQGRELWRAELDDLEGAGTYQAALILGFPTVVAAYDWYSDPTMLTQISLLQSRYLKFAGFIFRSPSAIPSGVKTGVSVLGETSAPS